ncbi:tail fiber domain-containing protein [Vibrio sp. 2CM40D]|uniref:tail fiber domain-containing protein n=1 Tax=Vibrio sp. 2CM40D TaxID=2929855 RepID=UPI0020BF4D70|nr:tail fiber domain-containing protein [Vibrio sp. 2CM40D]MCK8112487.1 tail fiber domain-containing protein [Vibrio sp. 2CM40D]
MPSFVSVKSPNFGSVAQINKEEITNVYKLDNADIQSYYNEQSREYRDKAHQWAEESENVEVQPNEYSAKHYSLKSRQAANDASFAQTKAEQAQALSESAEEAAALSEVNASTSEANAKSSETSAAESASAASLSESNSKVSELAAKDSENASATSEANAKASESAAATSETNAKASELASKNSESASRTSELNASQSATAAATSETNAKTSELAAKSSATNADTSASEARADAIRAEIAADAAASALSPKGDWDASTGLFPSPTMSPERADFYQISVAGTMSNSNAAQPDISVEVGDQLYWNLEKDIWYKIDNTDLVRTVDGMQGDVVIDKYTKAEVNAIESGLQNQIDTITPTSIGALPVNGTANKADKWTNARKITLNGDASGMVSIDGSSDVTLNVTVANNSHTHDDRYYTENEVDAIESVLQSQIDNRIDKDVGSLSEAEVDALFSAGKIEIDRTDSNISGIAGTRSLIHLPNGQGGFQLAARSIGSEIHVRSANAGDGTIGPWERIYTTGYKPTPSDIGALPDSGTAVAADKWSTPRTITVDGDVDGSVTIDGSSNETITTEVNPYIVWKTAQMDINDDVQRSVYFILADYDSGGFIGKIISHRRSGNTAAFQFDVHAVKQTTAGDNGSYYARGEMTQGNFDVSIVRVTHEGVEKLALKFADIPPFQKPQRASFFNAAPDMGTHEVICVTDDKITNEQPVTVLHNSQEKVWGIKNTYFDGGIVVDDGVISKEIKHPDNAGEHGAYLYSSGYTYLTASDAVIELRPKGLTNSSRRWTLDNNGTVIQYHNGGSAFKFRDGVNSGVGTSSFMEWQHADATRRGYLGYGTAGNNHMTWENTEGGNSVILKDNGRITLNPGTDNSVDMENAALYYGRSYCNSAVGGSWGHGSYAATALLNTNSGLAYSVFKMGADGPKMQALGEGGSTVRLYPEGGSSNFIAWQPHNMTHYYTGNTSMSWDMQAQANNVNTSLRLRESNGVHGTEFGYAGASSTNEFFLNMRENSVDKRAFSIYRDRSRAIFNTNRLDVESSGAEKMLLYRSDGDANVNIRYSSNLGIDVWAGKTLSSWAVGDASDLSSAGNQWMIISGSAATFRVPVVLDGGSPTGSHAIRRDWAEDNLLRRSVQSVTTQNWNTLYGSGHSSVNNGTGSNRPSAPTVGDAYPYGSLLAMSHTNTNSGVKSQLYFPHNQGNPDTSSRLPVYRSGYTGDYGNWRTLLTLQYADTRYTQVSSDERLKTDIEEVKGALDVVNQIGSYSYIKENAEITQIIKEDGEYNGSEEHHRFEMGFLAQEVEKVLPHIVKDDVHGYKAIKSDDNTLMALAYQAIREVNQENQELKERLAAIEAKLEL